MSFKEDHGASPVKDPEIIHQLGSLTAGWGALDNVLVELLCRLLHEDPAGEVIYFTLGSFKSRLDVIQNLIIELMEEGDQRKQLLLKLLERISDLSLKRNEMVHSAMTTTEDKKVFRHVRRPGRKVSSRSVEVKATDIAQHAQAVAHAGFEVLLLVNPVVAAQRTSFLAREGLIDVSSSGFDELHAERKLAHPLRRRLLTSTRKRSDAPEPQTTENTEDKS